MKNHRTTPAKVHSATHKQLIRADHIQPKTRCNCHCKEQSLKGAMVMQCLHLQPECSNVGSSIPANVVAQDTITSLNSTSSLLTRRANVSRVLNSEIQSPSACNNQQCRVNSFTKGRFVQRAAQKLASRYTCAC